MRASRTREKIIRAADALFGEVGFDAATTRQIAEMSSVNKALIHYHFKSKDELFDAILDRYYGRLSTAVLDALSADGDLKAKLVRVIDVYVDFLAANRSFSQMVQREASSGRHLERIKARTVPLFQGAMELLRRAYPDAFHDDLSGPHLLVSFYGMIVSYFSYSPVLGQLFEVDPLSESSLESRKAHLKWMLNLVVAALEDEAG